MITTIEKVPNTLIVHIEGMVTLEALKDHFSQILEAVEFEKEMHILWNAAKVTDYDITSGDLTIFGEILKKQMKKRGGGKSAWVISTNVNLGMIQMFSELSKSNLPIDIDFFHNYQDAMNWLKE